MKTALLSLLILAGCASPIRVGWNTPAAQIALARDCPGLFQPNKCEVYADTLNARLQAAGIESRFVGFNWTLDPKQSRRCTLPKAGSHAAVVYCDGGRWYLKDNAHRWPIWIHDASLESVQSAVGTEVAIQPIDQ